MPGPAARRDGIPLAADGARTAANGDLKVNNGDVSRGQSSEVIAICHRLNRLLEDAGYRQLCHLAHTEAGATPWPAFDLARNRLVLLENGGGTLALFFYLGIPIPQSSLTPLIEITLLHDLERAAFLRIEDEMVIPLRVVLPFRGLWLATDIPVFYPTAQKTNGVYLGLDSYLLAEQMPRAGQRVLDVCCGTGIHGLLGAAGGAIVQGTDLEQAAVDMAQINTALNGLEQRADFQVRDLLDGVEGMFDLVVSKPPCQAIPDGVSGYPTVADGGADGLKIVRRVLHNSMEHLSPSGRLVTILQMLGTGEDIPFADELRQFSQQHSCFVRLTVTKRLPLQRQADLLFPYGHDFDAATKTQWCDSLLANKYLYLYDAILEVFAARTSGFEQISLGFAGHNTRYRLRHVAVNFEKSLVLQPAGLPVSSLQQMAISLCDGTKTVGEIADFLATQAKSEGIGEGRVRARVDEIAGWLLENGYLAASQD